MKTPLAIVLIFLLSGACSRASLISPDSWDIGTITRDSIISTDLAISNNDSTPLEVKIVPTCECIFSEVESITLAPKEKKLVKLFLNPKDEEPGKVEKIFFINTNRAGFERIVFKVTGSIAAVGSGAKK